MEDYVVRYGDDNGNTNRSFYMNEKEANKLYSSLDLSIEITWKELIHEPLDEEEAQYIIKSDSVRVLDLGLCKVAVPIKEVLV